MTDPTLPMGWTLQDHTDGLHRLQHTACGQTVDVDLTVRLGHPASLLTTVALHRCGDAYRGGGHA